MKTKLMFRKELIGGLRFKAAWQVMLMFALTALSCISLALQGEPLEPRLQAALLWILLFFSSAVGMDRNFADEEMRGTLPMLKIYGDPQGVLFGKMAYSLLVLMILASLATGLFLMLTNAQITNMTGFLVTELVGLLGLGAAGTFLSALSVGSRIKSGLFSVLMLPIILPVFLPAISLTASALGAGDFHLSYLGGMILYVLILMVGASILFDEFWYEA